MSARNRMTKICPTCGKGFEIIVSQDANRVHCSRACYSGPIKDRFMSHVYKDPCGCWFWTAHRANGYGKFHCELGTLAHCVSYKLFVGEIKPGMKILHADVCNGRRDCVNPAHLRQGTQKENVADRDRLGKWQPRKGEANNFAKLKDSDIPNIFAKSRAGIGPGEIAKQYGVSYFLIRRVLIRKTYRHVPIGVDNPPITQ